MADQWWSGDKPADTGENFWANDKSIDDSDGVMHSVASNANDLLKAGKMGVAGLGQMATNLGYAVTGAPILKRAADALGKYSSDQQASMSPEMQEAQQKPFVDSVEPTSADQANPWDWLKSLRPGAALSDPRAIGFQIANQAGSALLGGAVGKGLGLGAEAAMGLSKLKPALGVAADAGKAAESAALAGGLDADAAATAGKAAAKDTFSTEAAKVGAPEATMAGTDKNLYRTNLASQLAVGTYLHGSDAANHAMETIAAMPHSELMDSPAYATAYQQYKNTPGYTEQQAQESAKEDMRRAAGREAAAVTATVALPAQLVMAHVNTKLFGGGGMGSETRLGNVGRAAALEAPANAFDLGAVAAGSNVGVADYAKPGLPIYNDVLNTAVSAGVGGAGMGLAHIATPVHVAPQAAPAPDAAPAQIDMNPDPLLGFPDGTIARRSEVEAHIATLPPEQQTAARAQLAGLGPQPVAEPALKPSEAMGLDPAAGPLSAVAAQAVDSGAHQAHLDQQQATQDQQASEANQAAIDAQTAQQAKEAQQQAKDAQKQAEQQDTANQPITRGPVAEAGMSDADKRAVVLNKPTATNAPPGSKDGDILNGDGAAFPNLFAATRRAKMEGADWEPVKIGDGQFVARQKEQDVQNPAPGTEATPAAPKTQAVGTVEGHAATTNVVPGTGNAALEANGLTHVDQAAHAAATSPLNNLPEPTEAQKLAGNYQKGHVSMNGLDLSIENPAGSVRSGVDKSGKAWSNTLQHHYGYIKGTVGNDKDHVDAFVKPGTPLDYAGPVFVVDQVHPESGRFDEHKAVIGAKNALEARRIYQANYAEGWKGLKTVTSMPFEQFKAWVKDGPKTTPLAKEISSQPQEQTNGPQAAKTVTPAPQSEAGPLTQAAESAAGSGVAAANEVQGVKPGLERMRAARAANEAAKATEPPHPNEQPTLSARQVAVAAEKARAEAKKAEAKAKHAQSSKAPEGLSVGIMPNSAEPVTVKDGSIYIGKYPAANFETGEDVKVADGATHEQIRDALKAAGALGKRDRIFGMAETAPTKTLRDVMFARAESKAEASKPAAKPQGGKTLRAAAYDKNPLMTFLATNGLYHQKGKPNSLKSEFSPDKAIMVMGYGPVFKSTGKRLDTLTHTAIEDGYLPKDGTESQLRELIRRAVAGEKISPVYAHGVAENLAEQSYAEHLAQQQEAAQDADFDPFQPLSDLEYSLEDSHNAGYDSASDPIKLEVNALLALAEDHGIDTDAIKSKAANDTHNESEQAYYESARGQLQEAIAAGNQNRSANDGSQGAAQEGLTSPTRQDVLAQQDRAAAGAKEDSKAATDAANKNKADAERGEFTLTGSDRPADVGAAGGQTPLFKRSDESSTANQNEAHAKAIEDMARGIRSTWKNAPEVIVGRHLLDPNLPKSVVADLIANQSNPDVNAPMGVWENGKVYLIAQTIPTVEQARTVLFHEALGHMGLRGVFGADLKTILQQVATMRRAEVLDVARKYGLDVNNKEDMLTAAEEVLANLAQTRPEAGFVQRAIAAIRQWLRTNVPGFKSLGLSNNDLISQYILPARQFVERGTAQQSVGNAVPAFSRSIGATMTQAVDRVKGLEVVKDSNIAADGVKMMLMPQARSDAAKEVSRQLIEGMGEKEMHSIRFRAELNKSIAESTKSTTLSAKARDLIDKGLTAAADKVFLRQTPEENYAFMQAMDTGDEAYFAKSRDLKPLADVIQKMFHAKAAEVTMLDTGAMQAIRENYFPHIWNREPGVDAQQQIFSSLAKRPLEGQKSFSKARVFDDVEAGLKAGFVPLSNNPLDLVALKMEEMDKYILAHKTLQSMAGTDGVQLIGAGDTTPKGYTDVNGRYGSIERDGQKLRYVARDDVGQVINNYLSQSLYHNKYVGKPFSAYMGAANMLNQFQLGVFSAFHAGFTSFEAVISHASIGIKALSKGDLAGAAKYLGSAPAAWINNPKMGSKIIQEMLNGGTHPEMAAIIDGLQMAGFKWQMDHRFRTDSTKKMLGAWQEGKKVQAGLHSIGAMVEQTARPITEWLVPRQKFGVFGEMYSKWMHDNPNATHEELRNSAQQIWNRVDSRLGQVVYDRMFMHNVTKNIAQMLIRAPGWTGGTILEVGGGMKDLIAYAKDVAMGKKPQGISDRAAYTLSMLVTTAVANALLTALFTGSAPDNWKDLVAFRTGNLDEHGLPERFMLPTYMKDVYAYSKAPFTTLAHKTHPLLSLVGDVARNKDYYGTEIRGEDDNLFKQLGQTAGYVAKAFIPFWMKGAQKESERGGTAMSLAAPLVGVMPAPSDMNKTEAENLMSKYGADKAPSGARTQEEAERSTLKRQMYVALRKGNMATAQAIFQQGKADNILLPHDLLTTIQQSRKDPLVNSFSRLTYEQAARVMDVATDDEKAELRVPFMKKTMEYRRQHPGGADRVSG